MILQRTDDRAPDPPVELPRGWGRDESAFVWRDRRSRLLCTHMVMVACPRPVFETRSLTASERQNDVGEGAFHEIWLDALIVNNLRDYNTEREGDRVLQNQRKGIEVPMPGARTLF